MSFEWKLARIEELIKGVPDVSLGDERVKLDLAKGSVEQPIVTGLEEVSFVIDASAEASIAAFNGPGDEDSAGVVGERPEKPDPTQLDPVLVPGEHAWLKYAVLARAKANAGASLPYLGGNSSVDASLLMADYHVHLPSDNARQAVHADARALRLPVVAAHVTSLQPNEALTLQVRAQLEAEFTVRWSDIFTANMSTLTNLLPQGTLVALEISLGSSLSGGLQLIDDFAIVFSRKDPGKIQVNFKKSNARKGKVAATIGVEIGAKDPDAFKDVLEAALEGLLAHLKVERFEELLDKWIANNISPEEREIIVSAFHRIWGIELPSDPAKAWEDLKSKVRETIQQVAKERIKAGFEYEYARLHERTTVFQLELQDTDAIKLHPLLITGRVSKALELVDKSALRSYFYQDVSTKAQSWGFSLGFGKWQLLSGRDRQALRRVTEQSSPEPGSPQRIAYLGTRTYEGDAFGHKAAWSVDFRCDMDRPSARPTAADFKYGLYLVLSRQGKLSRDELRHAVDDAIIWRVLDDADEEKLIDDIYAAAKDERFETRLELKISDVLFRNLLPLVAKAEIAPYGRALARAMPWNEVSCRAIPEQRQRIYAPLWNTYLVDKGVDWNPSRAARDTAGHLAKDPYAKGPANANVYWEKTGGVNSFAHVLDMNARSGSTKYRDTYYRWEHLVHGMENLDKAISQGWHTKWIESVFAELEEMWGNSFYIKAMGALLLELAWDTPPGPDVIERTFSVVIGTDKPKKQIVFGSTR